MEVGLMAERVLPDEAPMLSDDNPWVCACGETDITKHDLGMVIAHEYELSEEKGREMLVNIRRRAGVSDG